jgi:hypothetical protein
MMNDTELDEMLVQWRVPPAPASMRARVRAGFAARLGQAAPPSAPVRWRWAFMPGSRKALPAACMIGIGAFLWVVTQALSQTPPPVRPPYTVDSEYVRYGDDGSPAVEMYSTSYTNQSGAEILLSRSIPGHPIGTAVGRTLDAALPLWQRLMLPFAVSSEEMAKYRKMRQSGVQQVIVVPGCDDLTCLVIDHWGFRRAAGGTGNACLDGTVVADETILNYPTTAVERDLGDHRKMTLWMAPDLGCFALRITTEVRGPDGKFHLATVKQALKVTVNR